MANKDLQELIIALKGVRDALPEALASTATSMSLTAKALAERTIKDKGFGENYSAAQMPAYFFKGFTGKGGTYLPKYLNKRGLAYIEKIEKQQAKENRQNKTNYRARISWAELRKAQGLQTAHVDLTYSGKMWAGMFPQDVVVEGYKYIAPLGANNKQAQDEMNYNFERYGDFIGATLTGDNLDMLYNVGIDELVRFLDDKMGWAKQ